MGQSYPFDSIEINGKEILLSHIVSGDAIPQSDFESETFSFIRQWLGDEKCFKIQTSGSTGEPKVIEFSRNQLIQSAAATIQAFSLNNFDTAFVCIHTRYIGGKMMLVRAFVNSMKITCHEPVANPLMSWKQQSRINFIALVPFQLKSILEAGLVHELNTIDCIIIGGAPLSQDLKTIVQNKLKTSIYATFGMTETISHVALSKLNSLPPDEVYTTLKGVEVEVDKRNCLVIKAPYLAEKVITNDICDLHSSITFTWIGRFDDVINTGGIKIHPAILESKIKLAFKGLNINRDLFIFSQPDNQLGEKIILAVEGSQLSEFMLMETLQSVLQKYEVPKKIIFIPGFEKTDSGKINRFKIVNNL